MIKTKFSEFLLINEEIKLSKVVKRLNNNGFDIYIGRNAKMNDVLTFDIANDDDIWLHAKGVPGSHVVIKTNGKDVDDDTIKKAAEMAAINSKSDKDKVDVLYVKRKYVTKKPEHNDGQVSVDYSKSKIIQINKNEENDKK
jgi:predicted ribosome quality control (RQC) complex YloA/Tae2 family protein